MKKATRINKGDAIVSYSQFSIYNSCPRKWELMYVQKKSVYEPNIHVLFGDAVHKSVQTWLYKTFKEESVQALSALFRSEFHKCFDQSVKDFGRAYSSVDELVTYLEDGAAAMEYFQDNYRDMYDPDHMGITGVEYPLFFCPDDSRPKLKFKGFLDMKLTKIPSGKIVIDDYKTSVKGWSSYHKNDRTKISQLLLYGYFYSKLYDVDMDNICYRYIILNREFRTNGSPPFEVFVPEYTKELIDRIVGEFYAFIDKCFDGSGQRRTDITYPAIAGLRNGNCRFCEFAHEYELCPTHERKV